MNDNVQYSEEIFVDETAWPVGPCGHDKWLPGERWCMEPSCCNFTPF
jgi:hypothetical protein